MELAAQAGASGERPFASLLVGADGTVLIEDHNTVVSESDITAHPELKLARWAARELAPDVAAGTMPLAHDAPSYLRQRWEVRFTA